MLFIELFMSHEQQKVAHNKLQHFGIHACSKSHCIMGHFLNDTALTTELYLYQQLNYWESTLPSIMKNKSVHLQWLLLLALQTACENLLELLNHKCQIINCRSDFFSCQPAVTMLADSRKWRFFLALFKEIAFHILTSSATSKDQPMH